MKNLLLVTLITLTMMIPVLLSTGCATQKNMGSDWYRETPEAEHVKRYPHGHPKDVATDKNCYFVEKTNSYFCQFDWDE